MYAKQGMFECVHTYTFVLLLTVNFYSLPGYRRWVPRCGCCSRHRPPRGRSPPHSRLRRRRASSTRLSRPPSAPSLGTPAARTTTTSTSMIPPLDLSKTRTARSFLVRLIENNYMEGMVLFKRTKIIVHI